MVRGTCRSEGEMGAEVADLAREEAVRGQLREVQLEAAALHALQRSLQQHAACIQVALAVAHDASHHPLSFLHACRCTHMLMRTTKALGLLQTPRGSNTVEQPEPNTLSCGFLRLQQSTEWPAAPNCKCSMTLKRACCTHRSRMAVGSL